MISRYIAAAVAVVALCASEARAGGAVTISGQGDGPVTIVEKDGTVRTIAPGEAPLLNTPGPRPDDAAARKAEAERQEKELARAKAEQEAAARLKRAEEERLKAAEEAAKREKALKEQEEAREKEIQHYVDKDYTYGPGSAKKEDRTGAVVGRKKAERESGVRNLRAGGQSRVRYDRTSK